MKTAILLAALFVAAPALAEDARTEVRDALEKQADAPRTPPTLPEQASDRAREVHETIAFGKKGEAQRAAHRQAEEKGSERAAAARNEAAERAARGAGVSAEKAARAAEKAAAGMARSEEARGNRGAAGDAPANAGVPRK